MKWTWRWIMRDGLRGPAFINTVQLVQLLSLSLLFVGYLQKKNPARFSNSGLNSISLNKLRPDWTPGEHQLNTFFLFSFFFFRLTGRTKTETSCPEVRGKISRTTLDCIMRGTRSNCINPRFKFMLKLHRSSKLGYYTVVLTLFRRQFVLCQFLKLVRNNCNKWRREFPISCEILNSDLQIRIPPYLRKLHSRNIVQTKYFATRYCVGREKRRGANFDHFFLLDLRNIFRNRSPVEN